MTAKCVVRLLDEENQLLGWAEVYASPRGDGKLWCNGPVQAVIDVPGTHKLAHVSLHWCEINTETRLPFGHRFVTYGERVTVYLPNTPIITVGPMPGPLPPVTVGRPVAIGIPVGQMGARG